jgi:hypothetical protein
LITGFSTPSLSSLLLNATPKLIKRGIEMNKTYFMGIDTGTFESKGVIIDNECNVIATHAAAHGMENPKPNYFEHDADKVWWHDFCLIRQRAFAEKRHRPEGYSGDWRKRAGRRLPAC